VFHVFACLKAHSCSHIVLDPEKSMVDEVQFISADWSNFHSEVREAIPTNALEPRGNPILISFVDAYHAGNLVI
jgi:hypothetical protein